MKKLLIASLILNLIAGIFVIKKVYQRYQDRLEAIGINADGGKISYWLNRDEVLENLPIDTNSIVFVGTSLTQHFEFAEIFQNLNIKNRGITGDVVQGVINRLDPILRSNPKKIFIEIGINDLGQGYDKNQIIKEYKQLVEILKTELPTTKIYIQSIFPTAIGGEYYKAYCTKEVNEQIIYINRELEKYSNDRKIIFINIYSSFVLNGQLNSNYSADGLHLNSAGYSLWTKILKPYLEE